MTDKRNKVRLVRDKLYVNDLLFDYENPEGTPTGRTQNQAQSGVYNARYNSPVDKTDSNRPRDTYRTPSRNTRGKQNMT